MNTTTPRVYIAATRQNDGKTTTSLGLLAALQKYHPRVGYIKPVGQRLVEIAEQKIDEDTRQLVKALTTGTPIIITTLQKFPFVTETLEKLNKDQAGDDTLQLSTLGKRFAVIVDEAHSSQSGESALELKGVLNKDGIREAAATYAVDNC